MKNRWMAGILVLLALTFSAVAQQAQQLKCVVCGKQIVGHYYEVVDQLTGATNSVCDDCHGLDRCSVCNVPVKTGGLHLADGRVLCAREAAAAVASDDEAKTIAHDTHDAIDRLFSRYMTFPNDNVEISVVDKFHLQNVNFGPGFVQACQSIFGVTASNPLGKGNYLHTIDLLNYMSKAQLMAVSAHEYTHAWMNQNAAPGRVAGMDRNTVEGFCELVAYKYMASRNETEEMDFIKRNGYTRGKFAVMLAADNQYGFNTVVEWVENGEDAALDAAKLDRVRAVKDAAYTPKPMPLSAWTLPPTPAPTAVPAVLTLKGISGTPDHRFALINNATFESMEKGNVRVGQTNVSVRCLEIRADSVVIQVNDAKEMQQLFLHGAQ